jgi:predicted helicase
LHNPKFINRYSKNLQNEFPRIPLYLDFNKWEKWGKSLMDYHVNYEKISSYPLERDDINPENNRKAIVPRLISRKNTGIIEIDTLTNLRGIPKEVWDYRLGTYSAIDWVLERYKEKIPKDPTIRENFNTYKFADHKEQVIDLICKVCTVSVETMKIIRQMEETEE